MASFKQKRPDEKPTPEQAEFLEMVADAGGVSGVCCNWLDARKLLIMEPAGERYD